MFKKLIYGNSIADLKSLTTRQPVSIDTEFKADYGKAELHLASLFTEDDAEALTRAYYKSLPNLKHRQQESCSHSFNDKDECEYCGISYEDFQHTGEGIYE